MGARRGKWPRNATSPYTVFALPVFGPALLEADPTGWVVVNAYGFPLSVYQGKERHAKNEKSHTLRGGKSGLMNRHGLEHIGSAELIWKVEGITDCLTLESIIPDELRGRHVVITNSAGASERPKADVLRLFKGKIVNVIHDADNPGQTGASVWVALLAEAGATARNVQLPYTIEEKHGKDLRDWINEGKTYQDLIDLATHIETVSKAAEASQEITDDRAEQEICNLINLDVLGEHDDGRILVYSRSRKKVITIRDINKLETM